MFFMDFLKNLPLQHTRRDFNFFFSSKINFPSNFIFHEFAESLLTLQALQAHASVHTAHKIATWDKAQRSAPHTTKVPSHPQALSGSSFCWVWGLAHGTPVPTSVCSTQLAALSQPTERGHTLNDYNHIVVTSLRCY